MVCVCGVRAGVRVRMGVYRCLHAVFFLGVGYKSSALCVVGVNM